jgi:hypothetical protein
MTYPAQLGGNNAAASLAQLNQALNDPRLQQGMSQEQREQMRAALAQLPQASEVEKSMAQSAQALEAQAASASGAQAQMLREQAQRLRSGTIPVVYQGEAVERWTRMGECPK